jgi:hypothetical protein
MFYIEDEMHAELDDARFETFEAAIRALTWRIGLPWDQLPLRPPCGGWRECVRKYEVVDFDEGVSPWRERSRVSVLNVNASGAEWLISPPS